MRLWYDHVKNERAIKGNALMRLIDGTRYGDIEHLGRAMQELSQNSSLGKIGVWIHRHNFEVRNPQA